MSKQKARKFEQALESVELVLFVSYVGCQLIRFGYEMGKEDYK